MCQGESTRPAFPAPAHFLSEAVIRRVQPKDENAISAQYGCVEARVRVTVDKTGKVVESCSVNKYGDRRDEFVSAAVQVAANWLFKPNFGLPGAGRGPDYRWVVVTFIDKASVENTRAPDETSLGNPDLVSQLEASSEHPLLAASLATEVLRRGEAVIPLLLRLRGNRKPFAGRWVLGRFPVCDPPDSSWQVSLEVAALFLIQGVYYGRLDYANSAVLTDVASPLDGNAPDAIRKAWLTVADWEQERLEHGMLWLRDKHRPPLRENGVHFY